MFYINFALEKKKVKYQKSKMILLTMQQKAYILTITLRGLYETKQKFINFYLYH